VAREKKIGRRRGMRVGTLFCGVLVPSWRLAGRRLGFRVREEEEKGVYEILDKVWHIRPSPSLQAKEDKEEGCLL
jgi:hypothetical protein